MKKQTQQQQPSGGSMATGGRGDIFKQLLYAKNSVKWLLDNESGSVDFHGLEYWAGVVERLRKEIKESL